MMPTTTESIITVEVGTVQHEIQVREQAAQFQVVGTGADDVLRNLESLPLLHRCCHSDKPAEGTRHSLV